MLLGSSLFLTRYLASPLRAPVFSGELHLFDVREIRLLTLYWLFHTATTSQPLEVFNQDCALLSGIPPMVFADR